MAEEIIITYDREKFENGELNAKDLNKLIQAFELDIQPNVTKCKQYYLGEQGDSDTVVCNHAKRDIFLVIQSFTKQKTTRT